MLVLLSMSVALAGDAGDAFVTAYTDVLTCMPTPAQQQVAAHVQEGWFAATSKKGLGDDAAPFLQAVQSAVADRTIDDDEAAAIHAAGAAFAPSGSVAMGLAATKQVARASRLATFQQQVAAASQAKAAASAATATAQVEAASAQEAKRAERLRTWLDADTLKGHLQGAGWQVSQCSADSSGGLRLTMCIGAAHDREAVVTVSDLGVEAAGGQRQPGEAGLAAQTLDLSVEVNHRSAAEKLRDALAAGPLAELASEAVLAGKVTPRRLRDCGLTVDDEGRELVCDLADAGEVSVFVGTQDQGDGTGFEAGSAWATRGSASVDVRLFDTTGAKALAETLIASLD